jgi:hypothetical protein
MNNIETDETMNNVPDADGDEIVCLACRGKDIERTRPEHKYECQTCENVCEPSGRCSIE